MDRVLVVWIRQHLVSPIHLQGTIRHKAECRDLPARGALTSSIDLFHQPHVKVTVSTPRHYIVPSAKVLFHITRYTPSILNRHFSWHQWPVIIPYTSTRYDNPPRERSERRKDRSKARLTAGSHQVRPLYRVSAQVLGASMWFFVSVDEPSVLDDPAESQ